MYDVFRGGLVYFNILGNEGSFSWIAFILIPLLIIPSVTIHVVALQVIRHRTLKKSGPTIIAACIAPPLVGAIIMIAAYFYLTLFLPFSWTMLGLNLYLIMAVCWAYYYIYSSPEKPDVPQFQTLLGQIAVILAISSTLFFFFPVTTDMRMLADVSGNYHYYYFTFGQYGLIASIMILGIVGWHVLVGLEWSRIHK